MAAREHAQREPASLQPRTVLIGILLCCHVAGPLWACSLAAVRLAGKAAARVHAHWGPERRQARSMLGEDT